MKVESITLAELEQYDDGGYAELGMRVFLERRNDLPVLRPNSVIIVQGSKARFKVSPKESVRIGISEWKDDSIEPMVLGFLYYIGFAQALADCVLYGLLDIEEKGKKVEDKDKWYKGEMKAIDNTLSWMLMLNEAWEKKQEGDASG